MEISRLSCWVLSLSLLAQASIARAGNGSVYASWVELGPAGAIIARAVSAEVHCPSIVLNSLAQPMRVRAEPSANFPVLVCEATITPGTTSAVINGQSLSLPKVKPRRIIALGDTGCSIKPPQDAVQNCNDPKAWPARQVSSSAAALKPDLIIHVGDILYRERPCPPQDFAFCGNSPTGYKWETFVADFFTPQAA